MLLSTETHKLFTENVLSLLQKKDVRSVLDFLKLENRHIERYTTLTYPEIIEAKKHLAKIYSAPPINGFSYYQKILSHSLLISTGISELDALLQGGFFAGTIYEFCGTADSERLNFILAILCNVLCNGHTAFFLDTKRDFSAKLMKARLAKIKSQEECLNLLNQILIKHISSKEELISALVDVERELQEGLGARIIIIHSISVPFLNSTNHSENNNILNNVANILRYLTIEHNVVVIVTNLITTWIKGDFQSIPETIEKVACGKYWKGVPNVRIKIAKVSQENFEISLLKYNYVYPKEKCVVPVHNVH